MKTGFVSGLALAGFICLGLTLPQTAAAAPSPAGLSTGAEAAASPVIEVKKWKNKNWNKNWKKKNWRGRNVYRGPRGGVYVRGWNRRPYYGTVIAGVALGTIIAAAAAPRAPADNLCWYWTNPARTHGYWDYCY
jgi:PBCV-specific basic adaptor protein